MNYDWNSINAQDGSREKAFEELCAQLARAESPDRATFRRKGTPDVGVECYCILPDGSEWGWQAKYFHTLGPSQWQQLDSSVKTAIKKHPSLVRYFVCVPYDRPDARISGQKSAMERWDGHVEKWKSWAQERKMNVEFVWWGSSELWNLLSGSEHIGRLYFWFGKRRFDEAWFQARFNEARDTAGPRYTPEIHVDLPIAHDLATFGRSESLFHKISSFARRIRRELGYVTGPNSSEEEVRLDDLPQAGHALVKGLSAVKPMPIGTLPFSSITDAVRKVEKKAAEIEKTLSEKFTAVALSLQKMRTVQRINVESIRLCNSASASTVFSPSFAKHTIY